MLGNTFFVMAHFHFVYVSNYTKHFGRKVVLEAKKMPRMMCLFLRTGLSKVLVLSEKTR
jgi:hypothetical protein